MMAGHDIKVCAFLTADEYIFARDESEARGISISAFIRMLIIRERRAVSRERLSADEALIDSADPDT